MAVGVDQARHDEARTEVDNAGVRRRRDSASRPDGLDASTLHDNHPVLDRGCAGGVEKGSAAHDGGHRGWPHLMSMRRAVACRWWRGYVRARCASSRLGQSLGVLMHLWASSWAECLRNASLIDIQPERQYDPPHSDQTAWSRP